MEKLWRKIVTSSTGSTKRTVSSGAQPGSAKLPLTAADSAKLPLPAADDSHMVPVRIRRKNRLNCTTDTVLSQLIMAMTASMLQRTLWRVRVVFFYSDLHFKFDSYLDPNLKQFKQQNHILKCLPLKTQLTRGNNNKLFHE